MGIGLIEIVIIVATCLLCLIVLAGIGGGVWYMRKDK